MLSIDIHVVDADIPILLSLSDIDYHRIAYDNTAVALTYTKTELTRLETNF